MSSPFSRSLSPQVFLLPILLLLLPGLAVAQATKAPIAKTVTLGLDPTAPLGRGMQVFDPEVYMAELLWWAGDERDGREPGTLGALESAERSVRYFSEYGLEPVGEKVEGKATFFQSFPLSSRYSIVDGKVAKLSLGGKALKMQEDWAFLGGGRNCRVEQGELVFLGYGLQDEDMLRVELKGKVVVLYEGAPEQPLDMNTDKAKDWYKRLVAKVKRVAEFKAAALVLIPSPGKARDLYLKRQGLLTSSRRMVPVIQLSMEAAKAVMSKTKALGGKLGLLPDLPIDLEFNRNKQQVGRNVLALWRGSDPELAKEYVVIGAHRDHLGVGHFGSRVPQMRGTIHNGADDNATGSVGVLELARAYSEAGYRPKRSIIFMLFDAEEMGLLGSRYWCNNPTVPLENVVAMLNMDMIGRVSKNRATGKETCTLSGTGTANAWVKAVEKATEFSPLDWVVSPGGFGGSDHLPFLGKQIPAVFFNSGLHRDYHSPMDRPEKCNPDGAVEVLKVLLYTASEMAEMPSRPKFTGSGGGSRRRRPISPVLVGLKLRQDNEGVRVFRAAKESAFCKAGILDRDILLAIDGRRVKTISDVYRRLRRKRKGQTIKLTWRRGDQTMSGSVKL